MKTLIFIADMQRTLAEFPMPVRRRVGFALYQAQMGGKHIDAKPLRNVGVGVLRVVRQRLTRAVEIDREMER